MRNNLYKFIKCGFVYTFAAMSLFTLGCSGDNVAGGASGDAGVVAVTDTPARETKYSSRLAPSSL